MALQALLITMEWSSALLAKTSPPGSEVIIGKVTNSSQTSALIILIMFTTCVSSQLHVWPRAELSRESNLQWVQNLQSADCAVESHYTVYIVHMQSSHIVLQVVKWTPCITSCIAEPGSRSNSMAAQPGKTVKATGPPNTTVLRCYWNIQHHLKCIALWMCQQV